MYEVAYHLRMPLYIIKAEMPYDEYIGWLKYFEERPIGWRDDIRFMKILQSLGIKAKPEALFESLAKFKEAQEIRNEQDETNARMRASLKRSVIFSKLLGATGGDSPAFLQEM